MVAWTAKQALMLEMIWPLPCEVSVPATAELESAGGGLWLVRGFSGRRWKRCKEGLLRTLFQDDNRRGLAAKRHVGAVWALGIVV